MPHYILIKRIAIETLEQGLPRGSYLKVCNQTVDSRASTFHSEKRLVKLRVETCATFATIFVATQVTRPHAVTTRSLIVTLNARGCSAHPPYSQVASVPDVHVACTSLSRGMQLFLRIVYNILRGFTEGCLLPPCTKAAPIPKL